MTARNRAELSEDYPDLVPAEAEAGLQRVVALLDAGYRMHRAPLALRQNPPRMTVGDLPRIPDVDQARPSQGHVLLRRVSVLAVALIAVLLAGVGALAVANITNLGGPTVYAPQPVLGGFHRISQHVPKGGKPRLLFIGTLVDNDSASERWAVVKALDQFGKLSNVRSTTVRQCMVSRAGKPDCRSSLFAGFPGYPTFDWKDARYVSKYLRFVHKELIDGDLRMRARLTPAELRLFDRYVRQPGYSSWKDAVWLTSQGAPMLYPSRRFPLVLIGDYLQTGANVAVPGDMKPLASNVNLPFSAVQASLRRGRSVGKAPSTLVPDFNAETNLITALICHADYLQPRKVCGRSVIKGILKHVKK